jgi:virginiamycin B lyase
MYLKILIRNVAIAAIATVATTASVSLMAAVETAAPSNKPIPVGVAFSASVSDAKGQKLEGVMVSLLDEGETRLTTRFTNKDGTVGFPVVDADQSKVRLRLTGYVDQIVKLAAGSKTLNVTLKAATKSELLEQLPAHVWAERIHVADERTNREFRINCMMCHQMGYKNTRFYTTAESWNAIYASMANKGTRALLTEETREAITPALIAAFDVNGEFGMPRIPEPPTGKATNVEISEWRLGNSTSSMHDVAVGPDGNIYGVDTVGSNIWRLNPQTNEITELTHLRPTVRPDGTPLLLHTVLQGPDGKMWFTYAFGNLIASLDVKTEEMKIYEMSYSEGIYPHTMRFDRDGQLWFTISYTNQLGTIDPKTDKIVIYDMPTRNEIQAEAAKPATAMKEVTMQRTGDQVIAAHDEITTIPYGIDVTPDGKIWFSQFNNRRIGWFDKHTKTFHMVDTPFGGPRRFRADSKGDLWIPAYAEGGVYRYAPDTGKFTHFELPTGPGDAVYAVNIDPKDDTVWACGTNSDTMMHLDPATGNTVTYQLPSLVTFCREINFDKEGNVWTSYSQYPSASIEGGSTVFVRIKPL